METAKAKEKLKNFFLPYISLLPNYNKDDERCRIKDILCTNWQNDDLAGNGSYVNFQTGHGDAVGDVSVLRDGVGLRERGVWIAGEGVACWSELGTAAGAFLSGEGVGERIAGRYGREVIPHA